MGYFANNKTVKGLDDIEKNKEYIQALKDEGVSINNLIECLRSEHYKELKQIFNNDQRKNEDIMEPLLYAVKKEHGTFKVYECYDDSLKNNTELAIEILANKEPELIEGTPISDNKDFILEMAPMYPEVIKHMSDDLKNDVTFVAELCDVGDKDVTMHIAQECKMPETVLENPELSSNKDFMISAIGEDINSLKYADENLKNDYNFMKEICELNKEAIDYVANNTNDFSPEVLKGTQEVLKDKLGDNVKGECEEEVKKIEEEIARREETGEEIDTKLVARKERLKDRPKLLEERLKGLKEGDPIAIRYAQRILKCNINDEDRKMLEQALKIGEAIAEKKKEEKDKDKKVIGKDEIENATEDAKTNGIEEETGVIREEYENTKEEKVGEVGGKINEGP